MHLCALDKKKRNMHYREKIYFVDRFKQSSKTIIIYKYNYVFIYKYNYE